MKTQRPTTHTLHALLLFATLTSPAATLDLEQVNGTLPFEGMAISNQFQAYFGVSFRRAAGASVPWPVIARVGSPRTAFNRNNNHPDDTPSGANAGIFGEFFLTDNVAEGGSDQNLILDFSAPVSVVSGYILDIDVNEQVTISAYTNSTTTNAIGSFTITAGEPGTGDGIGTFWSWERPTRDIVRIEIASGGAPVGYDLFASDYRPPPATPATLGLQMHAGITIWGDVGRPYRLDFADRLDRTRISTNWHVLTNIFLPTSPYLFYDPSPTSAERFYRAVGLP